MRSSLRAPQVAFISTYPPRACGIATYTRAVMRALDGILEQPAQVIVMDDESTDTHSFSSSAVTIITQHNQSTHREAAELVNKSPITVLSLQHEYGIYGGADGAYLLDFLANVRKPIITTFHTVLPKYLAHQAAVTRSIISRSAAIVVMTRKAEELVLQTFPEAQSKIHQIPHGITDVPSSTTDQNQAKKRLDLEERRVLLTFGLMSPSKGIEYGLRALPGIVERYPNVLYIVAGQTHPTVRARDGEVYRQSLAAEVKRLGLEDNVLFVNRYMARDELLNYLVATDIYLAVQLEAYQIVSGTLTYAMGCGAAVIATPTFHAKEALADGRGILVPFRNERSVTEAVIYLLDDAQVLEQTKRAAYQWTRSMTWPRVAHKYHELLTAVQPTRSQQLRYDTTHFVYLG